MFCVSVDLSCDVEAKKAMIKKRSKSHYSQALTKSEREKRRRRKRRKGEKKWKSEREKKEKRGKLGIQKEAGKRATYPVESILFLFVFFFFLILFLF